jgi:integrase
MGEYQKTKYPGIFKYVGKKGQAYGIDYYGDGKRHRELIGPKLDDARAKLEEMRQVVKKGKYRGMMMREKIIFDELLDEYIKKVQDQRFFKNSLSYFIPILRKHFGGKLLSEIDYKTLEDFRDLRKNTPIKFKYKEGRPRSERTVDIEMSVLRKMFKRAFMWEWIERNPFDRGEGLFYKKTGKRERALTPEEMAKLIDGASPEFKPILLTAILTGLRKSDILGLRWEDIDLDKGQISLVEKKTGKSRIIHLGQDMTTLFHKLPVRGRYVFPGRKEGPLKNIEHPFETALRKSGIDPGEGYKKVVFHTLRHSCVSQLVEMGADSSMVRNYVNHASPQMTEHYTHLSEEFRRRTGQLLDGLYDVEKVYGQKTVRNEAHRENQALVNA